MTIALGLLHQGGILVCADTLISSGTVGWNESKVMGCRFADGVCLFAFAGSVDLAESCVQQCVEALKIEIRKPRSTYQIANAIRPVVAREYQTHVVAAMRQITHDYALLISIWSERDGVALYSTNGTSMRRSRRGVEAIGAGADIAQFLIRPYYESFVGQDHAQALAIYALSAVRRAMPGVIGGNLLVFRFFANDGGVGIVSTRDIEVAAKYSALFDSESRLLLSELLGRHTIPATPDAEFSPELERFSGEVMRLMRHWKKARMRMFPEMPALEALEVIRAVSFPDVMKEARRLRKYPTNDRSRQRQ